MKVLIGTTLWRRPRLERLCLFRFNQLAKDLEAAGHQVVRLAIVSDVEGNDLATRWGWETVWSSNDPLGHKHNQMARQADIVKADYLLVTGSDNWLNTIEPYEAAMRTGHHLVGCSSVLFVNTKSGRGFFFQYPEGHPRHHEPIGPGRLLSRHALESVDWTPWDPGLNRGLDASMRRRFESVGYADWHLFRSEYEGTMLVDFKTATNIWSYVHVFNAQQPRLPELDGNHVYELLSSTFPQVEVAELVHTFTAIGR